MYAKIGILLLIGGCTSVFCQDNDVKDQDKRVAYSPNPKDSSCGLDFAGPMVQLVTQPVTYSDALFWNRKRSSVMYVDRFSALIYKYLPSNGETDKVYIHELENMEFAAVYPIDGWKNRLVVLANQSVYIFVTKLDKDNVQTHSIKKIMDITDESRILTKSCITSNGRILVGTQGNNYAEEFPNIEKGEGKFIRVDLLNNTVDVIEDNFTFAGSVATDYDRKYRYLTDGIENKIWRREILGEGELELIFDMKNFNRSLTGYVSAITLDKEGKLWIGFMYSYQIIRFDVVTKQIIRMVPVTVPIVNSLAWGGLKYDVLYASSSAKYVQNLHANPAAGAIISITGTGATGWHEPGVAVNKDWLE